VLAEVDDRMARLCEHGTYRLQLMRFKLKTLFATTAIVSLIFGGLVAGFRPNPESEVFKIRGVEHSPAWQPCLATEHSSNLSSTPNWMTSESYGGQTDHFVRQTLFNCSYKNYFGKTTHGFHYWIVAKFNEDWSEYLFVPNVSGGSYGGVNTTTSTELDADNQTIVVTIRQSFKSPAKSEECRLTFVWNGKDFQLQNGGY